jgi:hypothetical protein
MGLFVPRPSKTWIISVNEPCHAICQRIAVSRLCSGWQGVAGLGWTIEDLGQQLFNFLRKKPLFLAGTMWHYISNVE